MHPTISLFLIRARITDLHEQARRRALARAGRAQRRARDKEVHAGGPARSADHVRGPQTRLSGRSLEGRS